MFQTAFQPNAFQNDAFQIYGQPTLSGLTGGDDATTTTQLVAIINPTDK
jgi:hypothetical protein